MNERRNLLPTSITGIFVVSILLIGCSAPTTAPSSPSTSGTPSASPSSQPLPAPEPALALACEDLVPGELGEGLLTEQLSPLATVRTLQEGDFIRPVDFATQQAGGMSCLTSNGERFQADDVADPGWVAIRARVLPIATATFDELIEFAAPEDPTSREVVACTVGTQNSCLIDFLAGEAWVHLEFWGIDPALVPPEGGEPPQVRELIDGVKKIVEAAEESASAWTAPTGTVPLGADCTLFFGPERIQADFGVSEPIYLGPSEDYASSDRAARELAPALECPWHNDYLVPFGSHSTLSGGEWAFREVETGGEFAGYDPLTVTGLGEGEIAIISCTAVADRCVADVLVAHNWLQFAVPLSSLGLDADGGTAELTGLVQTAIDIVRAR